MTILRGRPSLPTKDRRVSLTLRLRPLAIELLGELAAKGRMSRSLLVEALIGYASEPVKIDRKGE